jgi:hypothetical protein
MILAYLLSAMIVAMVSTIFWLVAGGSLGMAFVVYTMSGLLMIAAMASASHVRTRKRR